MLKNLESLTLKVPAFCLATGCVSDPRDGRYTITLYGQYSIFLGGEKSEFVRDTIMEQYHDLRVLSFDLWKCAPLGLVNGNPHPLVQGRRSRQTHCSDPIVR